MKLTDICICALPVADIADRDCALFLWATFPNLREAFEVITAWGFEYKTVAFTWVKRNKKSNSWFTGMGYWTRANAEICLLATKGKPKRIARNIRQIIDTPIERHSKKPDAARNRIVELMGDIPRIELFAREKFDGWDVFGNEVDSDIILKGDFT
jgi:N6-adenosine-specific RNA methylase IME4